MDNYSASGCDRDYEPPAQSKLPPGQPAETPSFLDFEASSLDLICSYPIEVGVCLGDGSVHGWLIRPAPFWNDWSEEAQAIHGISREQLMDEGLDVCEVARTLNDALSGNVYTDAWTFDSFWLHRLYRAARMQPSFRLESISMLLDATQTAAWSGCRRRVIAQSALATHRAANDALILRETWLALTTSISA